MKSGKKVDVCMQVFGKPLQTALALLTLNNFSKNFIDNIIIILEPAAPKFDLQNLEYLAELVPNMQIFKPKEWVGLESFDESRISDIDYRHSIRYQYGFETSKADFLLLIHNDVIFKDDIIMPFINNIGEALAIGQIGQCWNCPAHHSVITTKTGINNGSPCAPDTYENCTCTFDQLTSAYYLATQHKLPLRHNAKTALQKEYKKRPWPLPECRMNEWCTLINLNKARVATIPEGRGRPFGAYLPGHDLGVAWFRDMTHQGFRFQHMDISPFVEHVPGHKALFNQQLYFQREKMAANLIRTFFPEKIQFLQERNLLKL